MRLLTQTAILLFIVLFASCESKIEQGQIDYDLSYIDVDTSGVTGRILPEEIIVIFKGTKVYTEISRGSLINIQIVSDEAEDYLEMRMEIGSDYYYCVLDDNDMDKLMDYQPVYDISATGKEDSVAGLWCSEYTVKEDGESLPNAWFTEKLEPQSMYFYSPYGEITGVPLDFQLEQWGVKMKMTAREFTEREVTDAEFERDPTLEEMSFDDFYKKIDEMFDVLLER